MPSLSKSKILAFRQCPKRLWLEIHRPELREDSAAAQAGYRMGHQVGEVAKRIYDSKGLGVKINAHRDGYAKAFAISKALMADFRQPVFEAGFQAGGALAFADIMLPDHDGFVSRWKMIEVKSATGVKNHHRDDAAIQSFIARSSGVHLKSVSLACIDASWKYPGGADYAGLLIETDVTEEALGGTREVEAWIADASRVARQTDEPEVAVGKQCHAPFECGYCNYCNRGKAQPEFPLDWLPSLSAKRRGEFAELGIDDLRKVPDDLLNARQRRVKAHTLASTIYFDAAGAAADLAHCGSPEHFLDFETIQYAVPIWTGTRPYQQIAFQFSLHRVSASALSHTSFLDLSGVDPSERFARALITSCGTDGPIFVYNAAFETSRLKEITERFPELSAPLLAIVRRVIDLLPIARNRFYHPDQKGSWSIKAVLPAVVPELTYETLRGVKNGTMAMEAFAEAIDPATTPARRCEIEKELLTYCRLDTYGLVRLWQVFRGGAESPLIDSQSTHFVT